MGWGAGDVTAASLTVVIDSAWTEIVKSIDQTVTSNDVPADDSELLFDTTADKLYTFELDLVYGVNAVAGANPNAKFYLGENADTNLGFWHHISIATNGASQHGALATSTSNGISAGTAQAAPEGLRAYGYHSSSAGGNFALSWAQATSSTKGLVVLAGSILRYRLLN